MANDAGKHPFAQIGEVETGSNAPNIDSRRTSKDSGNADHQPFITRVLSGAKDQIFPTGQKMGWKAAWLTMVAETISLGVLSLPRAYASLGLVPGILSTIIFGIITTGTGLLYWKFKQKYPEIRSIPQAVEKMWGRAGGIFADFIIMVFLVFLMGGHLLLFGEFVHAVAVGGGDHCRRSYMVLALVINFGLTLVRHFEQIKPISWLCCLSIIVACFITIYYVATNPGLSGKMPAYGFVPLGLRYGAGEVTTFFGACSAFANIVLSFTGSICYLSIADEVEEINDFWKSVVASNVVTVTIYTIAAAVIYELAGQEVQGPALWSAGPEGAKVAYGAALPNILFAAVILANVACKRSEDVWYSSIWRGGGRVAEDEHQKGHKYLNGPYFGWFSWATIWWLVAYVIANIIPWYNYLLAVLGAFCGTWICLIWPAMYWLYIICPEHMEPALVGEENGEPKDVTNGEKQEPELKTIKKYRMKEAFPEGYIAAYRNAETHNKFLIPTCVVLILMGFAITGLGLYGSIMSMASLDGSNSPGPFSCDYTTDIAALLGTSTS